mmetsp:Transcript_29225/g.68002  ORF Transcript_29225/g.68002 Transcript_29225/m.68002 type:complete len:226 (-) Transcript_29225:348-1025(-)
MRIATDLAFSKAKSLSSGARPFLWRATLMSKRNSQVREAGTKIVRKDCSSKTSLRSCSRVIKPLDAPVISRIASIVRLCSSRLCSQRFAARCIFSAARTRIISLADRSKSNWPISDKNCFVYCTILRFHKKVFTRRSNTAFNLFCFLAMDSTIMRTLWPLHRAWMQRAALHDCDFWRSINKSKWTLYSIVEEEAWVPVSAGQATMVSALCGLKRPPRSLGQVQVS